VFGQTTDGRTTGYHYASAACRWRRYNCYYLKVNSYDLCARCCLAVSPATAANDSLINDVTNRLLLLMCSGYYTLTCDRRCPERCPSGRCDRTYGHCICTEPGLFGPACDRPCPPFMFGVNCESQCHCQQDFSTGCDPRVRCGFTTVISSSCFYSNLQLMILYVNVANIRKRHRRRISLCRKICVL